MFLSALINKAKDPDGRIDFRLILGVYFFIVLLALFLIIDLPKILKESNDNSKYFNSDADSVNSSTNVLGISDFIFKPKTEILENNNLTAILIIGIDTRGENNQTEDYINASKTNKDKLATRNTDTIMQAVYDHTTGNVTLISIPRDLGIDVRKDCLKYSGAINQVFQKAQASSCEGGGIEALKDSVEFVTGIKSQYHIMVTLGAFEDIIKLVGEKNEKGDLGIYVDNPKKLYDVYPLENGGWENVYFPEGHLFLTPHRALQFARSRQYSSDFDRARRQQLVVKAVLERLLSSDVFLNPTKINELISTFNKNIVFTQPQSLNEIVSAIDIVSGIDVSSIKHLVLDPEFGGHEVFLNKQPHGRPGPYYMVPTAWKDCPGDEFCKVKEKLAEELKYTNSD